MNKSEEFQSVDYIGTRARIEAGRSIQDMTEKLEMLRDFGFNCKLERHVGFWLLHFEYPRLRLVASGHAVKK